MNWSTLSSNLIFTYRLFFIFKIFVCLFNHWKAVELKKNRIKSIEKFTLFCSSWLLNILFHKILPKRCYICLSILFICFFILIIRVFLIYLIQFIVKMKKMPKKTNTLNSLEFMMFIYSLIPSYSQILWSFVCFSLFLWN